MTTRQFLEMEWKGVKMYEILQETNPTPWDSIYQFFKTTSQYCGDIFNKFPQFCPWDNRAGLSETWGFQKTVPGDIDAKSDFYFELKELAFNYFCMLC